MGIDELKEGTINMEFNNEKFLLQNLQNKLKDCEPIHIKVLELLYEDARENHCLDLNGNISGVVGQHMSFSKWLKKTRYFTSISEDAFYVCIHDLEVRDFIINVQKNPDKEWCFGIRPLGIRCLQLIKKI